MIVTVDPTNGSVLQSYPAMTADDIEAVVDAGALAARAWGLVPVAERLPAVRRLAAVLRDRADDLAGLVTSEMGKPLVEARGEVAKSALTAEFYADHGAAMLADRAVHLGDAGGVSAWVSHEPMGLVLAVMPWNFPVWQVMRAAIPTIAAGNGLLLKHSPNVTGSALAMIEVFEQAGLPASLVSALVVAEPEVPDVVGGLIADDRIAAVTLTGSNGAGEMVGAAAGRATKPSVLELGGSDAFVVLADADVEAAARAGVRARFTNAGQSCVCAKRFIVDEAVADEFIERFVDGVRALSVGDPTHPTTDVGPLARADLRDALQRQVDSSVALGATLAVGGRSLPGPGWFYEPTVLLGTGPGMPVFDEETFGPVAAVAVARDEGHAVALADHTAYGLGLSVWSASTERAVGVARRVTSGAAFVNATVASDPRVPFGGTKRSGHGRELADAGLLAFTNERTYWVAAPS
ncbi:succinate-semialdehyde dehydrogenase/glutarate-semialdehyde dehydrogenase [Humibacillus xanthopallidus]|uniref:Succinate-semialdehyde dehydrogenase/glutarate-semialdehyde dehydrogenase n=1 Tax=Humibacillus xanthopallidus TaxID=412689 RepID=A0A543PMA5_9MICO|nr:aldehyde dehydrogenase family protein [Humibacillus xanthopallidus]TQN45211.1 succinate-semialdehyde dehydrogenase/glutarate-semialdehyde dehydrogenase [Humibacillus xanthopallidus]